MLTHQKTAKSEAFLSLVEMPNKKTRWTMQDAVRNRCLREGARGEKHIGKGCCEKRCK